MRHLSHPHSLCFPSLPSLAFVLQVVISSPFLRCLQTAMTLAEQFDADVLVDHELGEVMGPEVSRREVGHRSQGHEDDAEKLPTY